MCEFRSQLGQHSPKWVPSSGSMAPCRSHHGNHTRQEIDRLGTESHQCKTKQEKVLPKLQVRPAGQAGYPISLVASLDTVPVKCCVFFNPCVQSFTSVQTFRTHTHSQQGILQRTEIFNRKMRRYVPRIPNII